MTNFCLSHIEHPSGPVDPKTQSSDARCGRFSITGGSSSCARYAQPGAVRVRALSRER